MYYFKTLFMASVCMITATFSAHAASKKAPLNVFIVTGQSNSLGIIKDGEPFEVAPDPVDQKIRFFWVDRDPRANIVSTSGGEIKTMQHQQLDNGRNHGHWSFEITCARDLYKAGIKNLMFIKASRGGGGSKFWAKGSDDDHMYQAVVETVNAALLKLKEEKTPFRIRGLLYLQGESDGSDAPIADQRAKTLLENLRKEFPFAQEMKMYLGEIAGSRGSMDITRQKHQELAERDEDFYFVPTKDLRESKLYKDNLHFNNEAKHEIGRRFAKTILESAKPSQKK